MVDAAWQGIEWPERLVSLLEEGCTLEWKSEEKHYPAEVGESLWATYGVE